MTRLNVYAGLAGFISRVTQRHGRRSPTGSECPAGNTRSRWPSRTALQADRPAGLPRAARAARTVGSRGLRRQRRRERCRDALRRGGAADVPLPGPERIERPLLELEASRGNAPRVADRYRPGSADEAGAAQHDPDRTGRADGRRCRLLEARRPHARGPECPATAECRDTGAAAPSGDAVPGRDQRHTARARRRSRQRFPASPWTCRRAASPPPATSPSRRSSTGAGEPVRARSNGKRFADPVGPNDERPGGTVEEWRFVNLSADTHPMHLHLTPLPGRRPLGPRRRPLRGRRAGGARGGRADPDPMAQVQAQACEQGRAARRSGLEGHRARQPGPFTRIRVVRPATWRHGSTAVRVPLPHPGTRGERHDAPLRRHAVRSASSRPARS